jgi:hypothetical protein
MKTYIVEANHTLYFIDATSIVAAASEALGIQSPHDWHHPLVFRCQGSARHGTLHRLSLARRDQRLPLLRSRIQGHAELFGVLLPGRR